MARMTRHLVGPMARHRVSHAPGTTGPPPALLAIRAISESRRQGDSSQPSVVTGSSSRGESIARRLRSCGADASRPNRRSARTLQAPRSVEPRSRRKQPTTKWLHVGLNE